MDLVTLNDDMQPAKLIENYDSLIWTERYIMGDFQLITGNVDEYMELLPEGTVLSLRESTVPMIVERHQIVRKKGQPTKLTIKGREFTSILNRRQAIQEVEAAPSEWLVTAKIPSDVAHFIMYKICVEGVADPADIFPVDQVQFLTPDDYLTSTGPTRQWSVGRKNLLAAVVELLQTQAPEDLTTDPDTPAVVPHGIRAIRPSVSGTAVGIEIYVGEDRSNAITFEASREQLDDGTYLFSKEGSATDAYLTSPSDAVKLNNGSGATGLDRRVILVESDTTSEEALVNAGLQALSQAHETAIFDGSINQDITTYRFNVDYGLGDIVKLVGDYSLTTNARVTEYIRSEDATGSKSYPTLTAIDTNEIGEP